MGELSAWHWAIVAVVAMLLFGSRRLPDAARSIGRSARILRAELRAGHRYRPGPPAAQRSTARASRPATSSITAGRLSTLPNASAADCSSSRVTTLLCCTSLSWP